MTLELNHQALMMTMTTTLIINSMILNLFMIMLEQNLQSFGSPNREYVDLEKERELTTPYQNKPLQDIIAHDPPPIINADDQSGGWYNNNENAAIITTTVPKIPDERVDVNYLVKSYKKNSMV